MKPYIIFSKKLCGLLLLNGCVLLDIQDNIKNPKYKVYIFDNTPRLKEVIEIYRKQKEVLSSAM